MAKDNIEMEVVTDVNLWLSTSQPLLIYKISHNDIFLFIWDYSTHAGHMTQVASILGLAISYS